MSRALKSFITVKPAMYSRAARGGNVPPPSADHRRHFQLVVELLGERRPRHVFVRADDVVVAALVVDRHLVPLRAASASPRFSKPFLHVRLEGVEVAHGGRVGQRRQQSHLVAARRPASRRSGRGLPRTPPALPAPAAWPLASPSRNSSMDGGTKASARRCGWGSPRRARASPRRRSSDRSRARPTTRPTGAARPTCVRTSKVQSFIRDCRAAPARARWPRTAP